ncbi:hypothetical protein BDZ91DRAFT_801882, partial [Kalaharituber pfeilii]
PPSSTKTIRSRNGVKTRSQKPESRRTQSPRSNIPATPKTQQPRKTSHPSGNPGQQGPQGMEVPHRQSRLTGMQMVRRSVGKPDAHLQRLPTVAEKDSRWSEGILQPDKDFNLAELLDWAEKA